MIVPTSPDGEIDYDELATLKELALAGAHRHAVTVSAGELADYFEVSKQTMARRIRRLLDTGHIQREFVADGQRVRVTRRGREALRDEFEQYRRVFEDPKPLVLRGTVVDGMGEGRHYIGLPGYQAQFEKRLGYTPYPGTLNVELDEESTSKLGQLDQYGQVRIDEWEDDERTYGGATCYPAAVESDAEGRYDRAHIITPDRTHHDGDQIELIAPEKLRRELDLDTNGEVTIDVSK